VLSFNHLYIITQVIIRGSCRNPLQINIGSSLSPSGCGWLVDGASVSRQEGGGGRTPDSDARIDWMVPKILSFESIWECHEVIKVVVAGSVTDIM
jgi:hypothetical protein